MPHNLGHNIGSLHNSPQTRDGYTELSRRGAVLDVVDIESTPWRPSVESLVRYEADFRFGCATTHIVRKAGKKFKKSRKFNVLDLYEIDMGGPYAPSVPCTVHKNDFYSLVWL